MREVVTPPVRQSNPIVFDSLPHQIIQFGGDTYSASAQTWIMLSGCPSALVAFFSGSFIACPNTTARFSVDAVYIMLLSYQWQHQPVQGNDRWINLRDGYVPVVGVVAGTTTRNLVVSQFAEFAQGLYRCVISNGCGTLTTQFAIRSICRANTNCDGAIDIFDYLDFVDVFQSETLDADFNSDGVIDFFDYLDFLLNINIGC